MKKNSAGTIAIPALKVRQWLADWSKVKWDPKQRRSEPPHWFYQFSIPASDLKALSGIYPRTTHRRRGAEDLGIQRRHEQKRSEEIARFVENGFPWSDLSEAKRESDEFKDLQKPGWLPTAIVVNILTENDQRLDRRVDPADLVIVQDIHDGGAKITLPQGFKRSQWKPKEIPPIEVIDGQHRLWAFEEGNFKGDFELPVVAFIGLDLSWQAYLFYTINIKPKKINASLAFDLYPLLRAEDWLTKSEGHVIYRETRAQELVDLLWSHPKSPWHHRINMLGETRLKGVMVTQAAWVRSLLASYIRSWEGPGVHIGGLFGSKVGKKESVLPWSRAEQAAFLIVLGKYLRDAVKQCNEIWAKKLRTQKPINLFDENDDPAFYGPHTLLNQDQGIRAVLQVTNDLCFSHSDNLRLASWGGSGDFGDTDEKPVSAAIKSLEAARNISDFFIEVTHSLARYDWRASSTPGLSEQDSMMKAAFRGSGGYKELRRHVLRHLAAAKGDIATGARSVIRALGY